jgi:hypothetical protein
MNNDSEDLMTDITDLFSTVATSATDTTAETINADLDRGRMALAHDRRQRRIRRSIAGTTVAAGVTAVAIVASQLGGTTAAPSHHPAGNAGAKKTHVAPTRPGETRGHPVVSTKRVKLVAYNGKQLHGFTVDKVPAGWFLSTSTQFALLIDPDGDKDNDPDAFEGKLAVLTGSKDVHGLPKGTPVTVNGEDGSIVDQGKYGLSLSYNTPNGIGIDIQSPAQLNWTDGDLVSFAEGVHMTGDAVASRG